MSAIKQAFGTEADEFGATLFVQHYLEELPKDYWQQYLGANNPGPSAVIDLLQLRSSWGDDDIFTLPDEATNYVVSVHFDDAALSMPSQWRVEVMRFPSVFSAERAPRIDLLQA